MKTDYLPDSVRTHFTSLGYRHLQIEYPDFEGIVLYLRTEDGEQQAAYYISKPSRIELVTTDELRRVLDLFEGSGISLQYAITTSSFSAGSRELAAKNGISLLELPRRCVGIARSIDDDARVQRGTFRPEGSIATGGLVSPSDL